MKSDLAVGLIPFEAVVYGRRKCKVLLCQITTLLLVLGEGKRGSFKAKWEKMLRFKISAEVRNRIFTQKSSYSLYTNIKENY